MGIRVVPVGLQPNFATEGYDEVMEFANGAIGLLDRVRVVLQPKGLGTASPRSEE